MAIHLVRHATAENRPAWRQPDDLRPLTTAGSAQAMVIADRLMPCDVHRIISSRYVRCTQTMQPLADKLGLQIEPHPALAEEAGINHARALFDEVAASGEETVICSHANILGAFLDQLHRRGNVELAGGQLACRTGSIWTVTIDAGAIANAILTLAQA